MVTNPCISSVISITIGTGCSVVLLFLLLVMGALALLRNSGDAKRSRRRSRTSSAASEQPASTEGISPANSYLAEPLDTIERADPDRNTSPSGTKRSFFEIKADSSGSGWNLSAGAAYPIHLLSTTESTITEVLRILDDANADWNSGSGTKRLADLLSRGDLRWDELNTYVRKYGPRIRKSASQLLSDSEEWRTASPRDRRELENDALEQAFEDLAPDVSFDDALLFLTTELSTPSTARLAAEALLRTSRFASASESTRSNAQDPDMKGFLVAWRISSVGDFGTCPSCTSHDGEIFRRFPKRGIPPFHISCRCTITPIDKFEWDREHS